MLKKIMQWRRAVRAGQAYTMQVMPARKAAKPSNLIAVLDWLAPLNAKIPLPEGSDAPYIQPGSPLKRIFLDRRAGGWAGTHIAPAHAVALRITLLHWSQLGPAGGGSYYFECADASSPTRIFCIGTVHQKLAKPPTLEGNRQVLLEAIRNAAAKGVKLLCTSEAFLDRGISRPGKPLTFTIDDSFLKPIHTAAKDHQIHLVYSVLEKQRGRIFTAAILTDDAGEIVGIYRKRHLSIPEYEDGIYPGSNWPVFDTRLGRIGLQICWDIWYAQGAAALGAQGAEIIAVPIAGDADPRHWDSCWRARALDNGVYFLTSTTHDCGGIAPSRIIAPDGGVISETRQPNGLAVADIQLPFAKQRLIWTKDGPCFSDYHNVVGHLSLTALGLSEMGGPW